MKLRMRASFVFATVALACASIGPPVALAATTEGCTPGEKQAANTALDVASYACIIANADLPDEAAIAKACGVLNVLAPDIKQVVNDFKSKRAAYAVAKMSASHCTEK